MTAEQTATTRTAHRRTRVVSEGRTSHIRSPRLAPKPRATAQLYRAARLWAGGIQPGKLGIGLVAGSTRPGKPHHIVDDSGCWEVLASWRSSHPTPAR
jgi:hypothetical protein